MDTQIKITGYARLFLIKVPKFIKELAKRNVILVDGTNISEQCREFVKKQKECTSEKDNIKRIGP